MSEENTENTERQIGEVPEPGAEAVKIEASEESTKVETPDFAALISSAVSSAMAELKNDLDSRLPAPEAAEETDVESQLKTAQSRVEELEAELKKNARLNAIRDNSEAAGVRASAAIDSAAVNAALESIDINDSKVVIETLKELAEKNDYLKIVTHSRVPKTSGSAPAGKATLTKDEYHRMNFAERAQWRQTNPDQFNLLFG